MVQSGTGPMNQTILIIPTRNIIVQRQFILVQEKSYHIISPNHFGKQVTSTHYVDANLYHDLVTGKAVTAILGMLNATPVHWHSKRPEFVATRTAVNLIIDICLTVMYLGVPINPKSFMFGDNKVVVTNATICTTILSKRSHLAAYHKVQEALAAGYLQFYWKNRKSNPADILSKHWGFATPSFHRGDTSDLAPKNQRGVAGFQPNMSISDESCFDSVPRSYSEKGVPKGSPKFFNLTLPFPLPKLLKGHIPLFPTYHNTNITLSYSIRENISIEHLHEGRCHHLPV